MRKSFYNGNVTFCHQSNGAIIGRIDMKKQDNKFIRPIHIVFLLALLGMLLLVIAASFTKSHDYIDKTSLDYVDISDDFRLTSEDGEVPDFAHLGNYVSPGSDTLCLYYRIPQLEKDTTLIYRSKDVYTSLFVDDTLIYETSVPDSRFYNRSPGNLWNMVTLDDSCSGALLTLKINLVYDTKAVTADHFFLGDGVNIIIHFVHDKLSAIFISIAMLLIGVFLIVLDLIPKYRSARSNHGLLYLGIYAFLVGVWSLLETNVLQFFVSDQRILQLINNIVMITDTLPLFMYLDCEYDAFQRPVTKWLCLADLVYILFCIFAQFTGIYDLHDLLIGSQIALVVGSTMFFGWIIYAYILTRRKKEDVVPIMLQMIGIGALFFTSLIEFTKFKIADGMDRAGELRLGMLFFIIFFGISNQIQTYRLMVQGMKYDMVSSLAYSDGLTSLGNRTAYLEQLDVYAQSNLPALGIVFLDINNLKIINDSKGHEMGDELIKEASVIIRESFGKYGKSYRIGGDEFCVLLEGGDLQSVYEKALRRFHELIADANRNHPFHLEIHIAHGFSICRELTNEKIEEAVHLADRAMYENKAMLKRGV